MNTNLRKKRKAFKKDFFKLLNNGVFEKNRETFNKERKKNI